MIIALKCSSGAKITKKINPIFLFILDFKFLGFKALSLTHLIYQNQVIKKLNRKEM